MGDIARLIEEILQAIAQIRAIGNNFTGKRIPNSFIDIASVFEGVLQDDGIIYMPCETTLTWTDSVSGVNTYDFTFDPAHFSRSSTEYNHDLAIVSMAMVLAVQSNGSLNEEVLNRIYSDFGFHTAGSDVYTVYDHNDNNAVACTISVREVEENGVTYKLIAVNTRGGNYGSEWVGNFDVGSGDEHRGFANAGRTLVDDIEDFCRKNGIDLENDNVKLWMTGFSRSAAVTNYAAHMMNEKYRDWGKSVDDIYVYTFATPNNVVSNGENPQTGNENIFNIVSLDDLVPRVPFDGWGYSKYGVTLTLPEYGSEEADQMINTLKDITGGEYSDLPGFQNWGDQREAVDTLSRLISNVITGTENFDEQYQTVVNKITSIIFDANLDNASGARLDSIKDYGTAVSLAIETKLVAELLNRVMPGLGDKVGEMLDDNFSEYSELLDQSTDIFSGMINEFGNLSSEEKNQIVQLITGVTMEHLMAYGATEISENTGGILVRTIAKHINEELGKDINFAGHIASTHRMETYLAWILSNNPENLYQ